MTSPTMPLQVRHVRTALHNEFTGLIDLSNIAENTSAESREQQFLSRSLAALAVRCMTGCDHEQAADSVIDGFRDKGVDAVAVLEERAEVVVVQAKWSDQGKGRIDINAARALVDGFRQIENRQFERFNDRLQNMIERLDNVLSMKRLQVHLVPAVMGPGHVSAEVQEVFDDARASFNGLGRYLGVRVLSAADLWNQVHDDQAEEPIDLSLTLFGWTHRYTPVRAFQGSAPAEEIAQWANEKDHLLFERNVRKSLGLTAINQNMVDTLTTRPEQFWLRNNGITVLCAAAEASFPVGQRKDAPIRLDLHDLSIVNGAQTVTAIQDAYRKDAEQVREAEVSVRVIVLPEDDPDLGNIITESTNRQNKIENRDYVALDPIQAEIRKDFRLSLDKLYVYKRGDIEPHPDDGCSIVPAAIALACAHRNPHLCYRVNQNEDLLWEKESPRGAYPILFGNQPQAELIWNCVQLLRLTDAELERARKTLTGRAAAVADHGRLLVVHLVFRTIGTEGMEENADWSVPAELDKIVQDILRWLVHEIDRDDRPAPFIGSVFGDYDRFIHLAKEVSGKLIAGETPPDFGAQYSPERQSQRRPRSRPAVSVLMDAGYISDGAALRYVPLNGREREAMADWLATDPRRSEARWVNSRSKPLLWATDGKQYSPSRLVMYMWELAGWSEAPVAVQGPRCWTLGDQGTLVAVADRLRARAERE